MTRKKLKPTSGPWYYNSVDEWDHSVVTHHGETDDGSTRLWTVASANTIRDEKEDNARLIAEAGTVHHECGLSPRELLDKNQDYKAQNARITVALRNLCKHFPTDADMAELGWEVEYVETACQAYDTARAVLATQKE